MFWHATVLPPLADHSPTLLTQSSSKTASRTTHRSARTSKSQSWNFSSADYDGLRKALQDVDWSVLEQYDDVSEAVPVWCDLLFSVVSDFVPLKTTVAHGKPWYSSYLRRLARSRDRLFRWSRGLPTTSL